MNDPDRDRRIQELTARLAATIPDGERAEAERLLAEMLPWELRNLATHPRPDALLRVVGDDLGNALAAAAPAARMQVLRERALRDDVQRTTGAAIELALRRYAIEHPARAAAAQARISDPSLAGLSRDEVVTRADVLASRIDALDRAAQAAGPAIQEQHRISLLHARMAAGSARSGSFATAAGQLADELRALGEPTNELDVH